MKFFLKRFAAFMSVPVFCFIIALILPPTPRAKSSLLFSKVLKDSLLEHTPAPRLILAGGSNVSFGIDSQMLKDSLSLNPINTAIHANLGLVYIMENTLEYIREGDIVLLMPEYSHFYGDAAYGKEELLRVILDVKPTDFSLLGMQQLYGVLPFLPKYAFKKFSKKEYFGIKTAGVYSVAAFNSYGDTDAHWRLQKKDFKPYRKFRGKYNKDVINEIRDYEEALNEKGASLIISFPAIQEKAYLNMEGGIGRVEEALKEAGFQLLGSPERYTFSDEKMFNTSYHLGRRGVTERSLLLIEDFRKAIQD